MVRLKNKLSKKEMLVNESIPYLSKRSTMILYSDQSMNSHIIRIVMAEKGIVADVVEVPCQRIPIELVQINPYGTCPTLIDRDLVIYELHIIFEYFDERFPYPPLYPIYPVARAKMRQKIYLIEKEWFSLLENIEKTELISERKKIQNQLMESLVKASYLFTSQHFFEGEEFNLIDCCLSAFLWRLLKLEIVLPNEAEAIKNYSILLFKRPAFRSTLTEEELQILPV